MAFEVFTTVGFETCRHTARKALAHLRGSGADVDRASQRVLTKQDALRTTQHFYLFQIEKPESCLATSAVMHAIHKQAYRLLKGLVCTNRDASHGDNRVHCVLRHRKVGHISTKLLKASNRSVLNLLAGDCRHRNRHILQTFGSFLCGYNHFFQRLTGCRHRHTGDCCTQR